VKASRVASLVATVLLALSLAACSKHEEAKVEKVASKAVADAKAAAALCREREAQEVAIDAYIYVYPLVALSLGSAVTGSVDGAGLEITRERLPRRRGTRVGDVCPFHKCTASRGTVAGCTRAAVRAI
jgi:hypothetical protein